MYNLNRFNEKDNKINLVLVEFSLSAYQKLKENKINSLTDTAQDMLHLLAELAKLNKVRHEMKLILVDDKSQKIDTYTCGNFKLYFYKNLFDPVKNSKILEHEHLTKRNYVNIADQDENECRIKTFLKQANL